MWLAISGLFGFILLSLILAVALADSMNANQRRQWRYVKERHRMMAAQFFQRQAGLPDQKYYITSGTVRRVVAATCPGEAVMRVLNGRIEGEQLDPYFIRVSQRGHEPHDDDTLIQTDYAMENAGFVVEEVDNSRPQDMIE